METKEVARRDDVVPTFAVSLEETSKRFAELQAFVKSQMVEGEDYGKIPGCPKPSLFKPGAEKLATLYGLSVRLDVIEQVKDWDKGFFHYQVKCSLVSMKTGFTIAEGLGSCNSKEKRYRNQDAFTLDNTILKMGKKRAVVDAVLTATRTSGLFTQDVEDIIDVNGGEAKEERPKPKNPDNPASDKQKKAVYAICRAKGLNMETALKEQVGTDKVNDLTMSQASTMIDWLQKQD